jgi:hypothetical protein
MRASARFCARIALHPLQAGGMRPATLRAAPELAAEKPHGTRIRYVGGCRCLPCRMANARYATERAHAIKAGDTRGIVSAEAARRHIVMLGRRGVGYKTVADSASVARSVVAKIRSGEKTRIRAHTERRILAVTPALLPDSALVSGAGTRRRIAALLEEGYTKAFLARELGAITPALQIATRERVTVKTRARVLALYRRLTS